MINNHLTYTFFFRADGHPRPQPRPRFWDGRVISNSNPESQAWKRALLASILAAKKHQGWVKPPPGRGVAIRMMFAFPSDKEARIATRHHTQRPDTDNLAKLVMDCIQQAGLMDDDACVCRLMVEKVWCPRGMEGVAVTLASLGAIETQAKTTTTRKKKKKDA